MLVRTGTTATIAVTFSAASARGIISVYTLTGTGGRFTAHDVKVDDTGATTSVSLLVPRDGASLSMASFADNSNAGTVAWTGLTENAENGDIAAYRASTASLNNQAHSSGLTVQAVATAAVQGSSQVAVSFAAA